MKVFFQISIWVYVFLFSLNIHSQCDTKEWFTPPETLSETSGLLYVGDAFYTFNDSGGKPELYEIDTKKGDIKRTVKITNAKNVDWEAITMDSIFIYIGDVGNNYGTRKQLKIYKIKIQEVLENGAVEAKEIILSYANQKSFENEGFSFYDAETLVVINDSLMMLSKNWESNVCYYYHIPKIAGNYSISPIDSMATRGMVTDATFDTKTKTLYLVGYGSEPFLMTFANVSSTDLKAFKNTSCSLNLENSPQIEGLAFAKNKLFFTSEYFDFKGFKLDGAFGEIKIK